MADFTGPGRGPTLPASVRVAFPARVRLGIGCGAPTRYEVAVLPAEVLGSGFDFRTHPGHKRFRSSAPAVFDDAADAGPANAAELLALARRVAYDYYRWRLVRRDVAYPGTVAYEPDGTADLVTWTYRDDEVVTRVTTPAYDVEPEDLVHGLACDGDSSSDGDGCGGPGRPDADRLDTFAWVWYPEGGIDAAEESAGRVITPRDGECEVMAEGEGGKLCPSGVFRTVWNYWPGGAIQGDRLGTARCWRGRLVAELEDCIPGSSE